MKKTIIKKMIYVLLYSLIVFSPFYAKPYFNAYGDLKTRMCYDFEYFGEELEKLNANISQILLLESHDFNADKDFINKNAVLNFSKSNRDASDYGKSKAIHDYDHMYLRVNNVIKSILSDDIIDFSEEEYLKALYSYNDQLIKEYKIILGDLYDGFNSDQFTQLKKNIIKIYNSYSQKSEELLHEEEYKFLKSYKGNFEKADFEKAKKYCEQVFSELVEAKSLEYDDDPEQYTDIYEFNTQSEYIHENKTRVKDDTVSYKITYEKKTGRVAVQAVSYWVPSNMYSEEELDKNASEIVSRFDDSVLLYDKKIKYDDEGKINYITYSYIKKVNDVYDEMKKIKLILESHGLISTFEIVYPYEEEMVMPEISREDIMAKLSKEAQVMDIMMIRNMEGKIEYEAVLKYADILYSAVFDGSSGELKYFGQNLRNYNNPL